MEQMELLAAHKAGRLVQVSINMFLNPVICQAGGFFTSVAAITAKSFIFKSSWFCFGFFLVCSFYEFCSRK